MKTLAFNAPRKMTVRVTYVIGYETAVTAILYKVFTAHDVEREWNTNFTEWVGDVLVPQKTLLRLLWESPYTKLVVIDGVVYTRPNADVKQREIDNKSVISSWGLKRT